MGQCLRGKMTDAGLIPVPASVVAEPEAAPSEEVAVVTPEPETPTAEPPTDVAEPALDVTPAEPAAEVPENLIAATFGLLRAEPDGSVVIAGSGTPGTEVEVYSNDTLLGKATVETSGDWVLVPDAPLPIGGVEITLGETGKTGRAAESFVVAISEDKTSQPLVVASTPGAASEILQGLEAPAAGTTTEVAAAEPVTPAAPAAEPAQPAADPTPAPAADAASTETPEAPAAEPAPAVAPAAEPAPAVAPAAEPAPSATPDATSAEPAVAAAEPSVAEAEPVVPTAEPTTPPAEPAVAVAAVEPAAATPAQPTVVLDGTPPTIDAIELEGDRTFFAGGGPEGATMRLYVDDVFIADAKVEAGRWLVEAGKVLTKPSQRVRVDMLQVDSAKVASRAEVNFVVEPPIDAAPVEVAQAEPPAQPEPAAPEPATPATEPAAPAAETAAVEPAAPEPDVAEPTPAVETVKPEQPVAAAVEAGTTPAEPAAPAATPVTAEAPAPAVEAKPEPTATAEAAPVPAVEPTPEPVPDVPTMVAVSIGDPDAERFVSGKAIIRRGDNLWTIARRTYGEGIKYTTIYQANTGQIRDPDRIYPGQVFDLPEDAAN
jgi:nucleoid-associated protein YgaU